MFDKKRKYMAMAIVVLLVVGVIIFLAGQIGTKVVTVDIDGKKIKAEVVSKDDDLQKGLGDRVDLCVDCGMLFQFPREGKHSFWMKDMRFPLDMLWISQGKIVHIEKNIPPNFGGVLTPDQVADQVLEINAGIVDAEGIKIGDSISF